MGEAMVEERPVKKQLELDFSTRSDEMMSQVTTQAGGEVICFRKSKLAIALRSKTSFDHERNEAIRSRIDSLLARYK